MRKRPQFAVAGIILMLLAAEILFAEMTVEDPRVIGKGRFKIRSTIMYIQAQKCYSDEVWKAFHDSSPYSVDYDKMVDLPDGWHMKTTRIATGFEYGITDRFNVGVFLPYVIKDFAKQVWSKSADTTVWKKVEDNGFEDIWLIAKYLIYSKSPGLLGFNWKDGLLLAFAFKPSVSPDEKIKEGIGTGTNDFKILLLSLPRFSKKVFLYGKVWYQHTGRVKDIDGFAKSGWDLGDRFGYRFFLGYKIFNRKFTIVGGPLGWIAWNNKDKDGNEIEDSNTYSHGVVLKLILSPFSRSFLLKSGVKVPLSNKIPFAPAFTPFLYVSYLW